MKTRLVLLILLILMMLPLLAQPDNPNNPVPLDGGIGLLAAGGIALAVRKLKNWYKDSVSEKTEDTEETKEE